MRGRLELCGARRVVLDGRHAPGVLDLDLTTEQIDEASRTVLSPEEETDENTDGETDTESPEPTETPSE